MNRQQQPAQAAAAPRPGGAAPPPAGVDAPRAPMAITENHRVVSAMSDFTDMVTRAVTNLIQGPYRDEWDRVMQATQHHLDTAETNVGAAMIRMQARAPILTQLPDFERPNLVNEYPREFPTKRPGPFKGTEGGCLDFLDRVMSLAHNHRFTEALTINFLHECCNHKVGQRIMLEKRAGYNLEQIVRGLEERYGDIIDPELARTRLRSPTIVSSVDYQDHFEEIHRLVIMATRTTTHPADRLAEEARLALDATWACLDERMRRRMQKEQERHFEKYTTPFTARELQQKIHEHFVSVKTDREIAKVRSHTTAKKATSSTSSRGHVAHINAVQEDEPLDSSDDEADASYGDDSDDGQLAEQLVCLVKDQKPKRNFVPRRKDAPPKAFRKKPKKPQRDDSTNSSINALIQMINQTFGGESMADDSDTSMVNHVNSRPQSDIEEEEQLVLYSAGELHEMKKYSLTPKGTGFVARIYGYDGQMKKVYITRATLNMEGPEFDDKCLRCVDGIHPTFGPENEPCQFHGLPFYASPCTRCKRGSHPAHLCKRPLLDEGSVKSQHSGRTKRSKNE